MYNVQCNVQCTMYNVIYIIPFFSSLFQVYTPNIFSIPFLSSPFSLNIINRKSFTTTPNHSIRRIIGSMSVTCQFCHKDVQRSNISDHEEMCPDKLFICPHCSHEGKKDDVLNHLITLHAKKLLVPQQTTQDDYNIITATINSDNRMARLGLTGKFYCEANIEHKGCGLDGFCGPTDGCNCVACMRLDCKKRRLPHGYLVNSDGCPSTAILSAHYGHGIYCGRKVLKDRGADGYCGPNKGPNCKACANLGRDLPFYRDIILKDRDSQCWCGTCIRLFLMIGQPPCWRNAF